MGARAPPTHSEADNRSKRNDHRRTIRGLITEELSEDRSQKNDQRIDHKTDPYKNDQRIDPYRTIRRTN